MHDTRKSEERRERIDRATEEVGDGSIETLRLGHDVRFMLVVVGGGAARVGQAVARRHLRYLETVAVNCDARVQELEEFDRRIYLGAPTGADAGTGGSPAAGARRAHAAGPALDRLFEGVTCVAIVASLGGGSGTGALPYVLESAARSAEFVSVYAIKPFACEGERRAVADRALARLHFVEGFVDKREGSRGTLHVLDNERLAAHGAAIPFARLGEHWADVITEHIEQSYLMPIEATLDARRYEAPAEPPVRSPVPPSPRPEPALPPEAPTGPMPMAPQFDGGGGVAELTFEVLGPPGGEGL